MRLPQMGDVVLYYSTVEKRQRPALVTDVRMNSDGISAKSVDIWLFPGDRDMMYLEDIEQGMEMGRWQWPDIPIADQH